MAVASVETLPEQVSDAVTAMRRRVLYTAVGTFAVLAIIAVAVPHHVPTWLDLDIQTRAQDFYKWSVRNRQSSPVFTRFFQPLTTVLQWMFDRTMNVITFLRWPGVVALTGAVGWRTGGIRAGLAGAVAMLGVGVISDWERASITLGIMFVAVMIALLLGIPIGVWTARSEKVEQVVRVVLDTMQVMPIFVYFSPVVVFFGIKVPPAIVVTVIYALPPAVRLTNLGLRNVPVVLNEVGESFGTSYWQQLFKVQLPVARRTILLGLNQVIMMAFGVVVLASLLGTGDVGQNVLNGLQKQKIGAAASAGLAIVLMAVALDRVTTGERIHRHHRFAHLVPKVSRRTGTYVAGGVVVLAVLLAHVLDLTTFPSWLTYDVAQPIDDLVKWVQDHFRHQTQWVSDNLVIHVINPLFEFLRDLPWLLVVVALAAVAYFSKGWKLAVGVSVCMVGIAALGSIPGGGGTIELWELAMNTLSLVVVAIVLSVVIALPLGILAARSDRFERVLRPFLDIAQVLPAFVYLIPVVFLFGIGRAAGVVACVIYAVPPCIRLTSLGMREVPYAPREAAISFGATGPQEMKKVQLPLARKAILLGINQTLMMVLATVIIAALIGSGALGLVAYEATTKPNIKLGQGVAGGLAIVLLAIMLDRITQAWGTSKQGGNHQ